MNTAQSTNGIALREPCTHQVGPVLWERSFDFTHLPLLQLLEKYHISASWCHQIPIKSIIATIWGHGSSTSWSCGGFGLHGMFVMSKTFSWTLAAGSSTYLCLTSTHSLSLPWSKQTGSHVTTTGMAVSLRDKRLRVWGRIGIKLCLPAKNTMHSCTFSLPAKNIKVYRMYEKKNHFPASTEANLHLYRLQQIPGGKIPVGWAPACGSCQNLLHRFHHHETLICFLCLLAVRSIYFGL